ncbi:hypothetical protein GCM10027047_12900 [Rhodococcus aerolatus]
MAEQPPADADRSATDATLQAAVGRGELGLAEYEDRSARAWAAASTAELAGLTADLARPAVSAPAGTPRGRTQHTVAVLSENTSSAAVAAGEQVAATAVLGRAEVDLRRTDLPQEVHVRAVSLLGETAVLVPRGVAVRLRGPAVLGHRRADVGTADTGAPVVIVTGASVLGSVTVSHGDEATGITVTGVTATGVAGTGVASQGVTADVVSADAHRSPARRGRRRGGQHGPWARVAAAVAVVAAGYGLVQVAGADHGSVFGSGTVNVTQAGPVDVGMLFGSYEVVVPDGAHVDTSGLVVFGSTSCEAACTRGSTGPAISVHATGAFGSVTVLTATEAAQRGDRDRGDR